jgi:hypothetical protein
MENSNGGKRRRGRRSSHGRKSGRLFWRDEEVVFHYNRLRSQPPNNPWEAQKHSWAVSETVRVLRELYPKLRISETEVKRVLAKYQPKDCPISMFVTAKPQQQVNEEFERLPDEIKEFLGNKPPINVRPFGFAPRPRYRTTPQT